jgi:hypothetical protein
MFEHKSKPLLTRSAFFVRMARSGAVVTGIIVFSLFLGSAGYHYFGSLPWIDALLNASRACTKFCVSGVGYVICTLSRRAFGFRT